MRNKRKAFDCVRMKREIQRRLGAEMPRLSEEEKRQAQLSRASKSTILGPFLRRLARPKKTSPKP
jgi:hypothetical protein